MEVFEREMLGMQLDRSNPTINTFPFWMTRVFVMVFLYVSGGGVFVVVFF